MKCYVAGMFSTKEKRQAQANELFAEGIEVTSRWMQETTKATAETKEVDESYLRSSALLDLEDINEADFFIEFVPTAEELVAASILSSTRGGRNFEMGYAFAQGLAIIVVGPKENCFHYLPNGIHHFDTFEEAKEYLVGINELVKGRV